MLLNVSHVKWEIEIFVKLAISLLLSLTIMMIIKLAIKPAQVVLMVNQQPFHASTVLLHVQPVQDLNLLNALLANNQLQQSTCLELSARLPVLMITQTSIRYVTNVLLHAPLVQELLRLVQLVLEA